MKRRSTTKRKTGEKTTRKSAVRLLRRGGLRFGANTLILTFRPRPPAILTFTAPAAGDPDVSAPAADGRQNILIVKLGAFGNIILSLAAFAAIRQHHAAARISVLTSAAYADWLRTFPYFDEVLVDPRPAWWDLPTARRLGQMLADGHFNRVYDLQTSTRSSRYFHLFPAKHRPEWSGIAFGCSHAGPRSAAQCPARHRAPAGAAAPGRDHRIPAGRPVLVPRRHRPLRPARRFRAAGSRQFAGPPRQALAGRALSGAGRSACRTWDRPGHRGRRRGAGTGCRHPSRDRPDRPDQLRRPGATWPGRRVSPSATTPGRCT